LVVGLLVCQSFLDFFGLAFFLPLIFLIVNPTLTATHPLIHTAYEQGGFKSPASFIIFLTIAILIFAIAKNLLSLWIVKKKARYAYGISADLSSRGIRWYSSKDYRDFSGVDFSKVLNLVNNYPLAFANNILLPVGTLLSELLVCLLIVTSVAIYDYKILILLSVILAPIGFFYRYNKKQLKKVKETLKEQYPLSVKYALQVIEGLVEIRIFAKETFFKERYTTSNKRLTKALAMDHIILTSTTRITEIVTALIVCSLILYAVLTQRNYQQTILLLGIYASASFRIIPSINRILHGSLQLRTHEYLIQEMKVLSDYHPDDFESLTPPLSFEKSIELRNISVRYKGGPHILHEAGLIISKGEKIALTGKSGEGKTTLLLLLIGFLKSDAGEILIDGKKIEPGRSWRAFMGYVPQNPYILDGSLAENVAFGVSHSQIDRQKILRLMNDLGLMDLVKQLPHGLDEQIGERGVKLSGGQRQRLAIARALYADASILVLDEVTNQVNLAIELEIMDLLDDLAKKGKTILMVTHKIARQDFFDSIYTLTGGKIQRLITHA